METGLLTRLGWVGCGSRPGPRVRPVPCPRSLTKDMTGKEDSYRGPAVRALCQITDVSAPLGEGRGVPRAHTCSPPPGLCPTSCRLRPHRAPCCRPSSAT